MRPLAKCLAALAIFGLALAIPATGSAEESDPFGALIDQARQVVDQITTDLKLHATLYHSGANGVGHRDSLGCAVVPMRTLAVDPTVIPKRAVVFIKETVGMLLPDGSVHDGMWYASDTGGAIKGKTVDLFTGSAKTSLQQFGKLNIATLNAAVVGSFDGCPPK